MYTLRAPHEHKSYPSTIAVTRKIGGCAQQRLDAAILVHAKLITFTRPSTATLLLSHIIDYLMCTQND